MDGVRPRSTSGEEELPEVEHPLEGCPPTMLVPIAVVLAGAMRQAHSGHVGDNAAWYLVGLATLAAFTGSPLR